MVRLVLFDIDGTLVDAGGAGSQAMGQAWELVYGDRDAVAEISFGGRTDASLTEELYERHGHVRDESIHAHFLACYHHLLADGLPRGGGRCLAGASGLVDAVAADPAGVLVGLLTGNSRLAAEIKLRYFNLWEPFEMGAFGDLLACRNALAQSAREQAEAMLGEALADQEVLVIGDTCRDVECARSIGARCLAVTTGSGRREALAAAGADWVVDSLQQVSWATLRGA